MQEEFVIIAFLYLKENDEIKEIIEINRDLFVIGAVNVDLLLNEEGVSASHCQIQKFGNDFHVFDLNSVNGTFVNGQRIVKSKLNNGDYLKIANFNFEFVIENFELNKENDLHNLFNYNVIESFDKNSEKILEYIDNAKKDILNNLTFLMNVNFNDGHSEIYPINAKEYLIGRLSPLGVFIKDDEMSRKHSKINIDNLGFFWLEDLGSTNGTFVNHNRIENKTMISDNDKIKIGKSIFQFLIKKD